MTAGVALVAAAAILAPAATAGVPPNPTPQLGKPTTARYQVVQGRRYFCRSWVGADGFVIVCQRPTVATVKPAGKKLSS